jgi:hypothetical protein
MLCLGEDSTFTSLMFSLFNFWRLGKAGVPGCIAAGETRLLEFGD